MVILFRSVEKEIQGLKRQTLVLARAAISPASMKAYLHCYEILEMTENINKPWTTPGVLMGDMAAFVDLQCTLKDLIHGQDPTGMAVRSYALSVANFVNYWRISEENRMSVRRL